MIPLLADTWPDFALFRVVRPHAPSPAQTQFLSKLVTNFTKALGELLVSHTTVAGIVIWTEFLKELKCCFINIVPVN